MSSSSLSAKFCFNSECFEFKPGRLRPGWRLRSGDFADLCDRCASAYEEGKFCEIYHLKASGWRCCELCRKRIHCGCIVSAYAFMLLDAGGIKCLACARKNVALAKGPSFSRSASFILQPPIADKLEYSSKNWCRSSVSGQTTCWQAANFSSPLVLQSDLHNCGAPREVGQSTSRDRATTPSMEKREKDDCPGKLTSESLKLRASDIIENGKAGTNCDEYLGASLNAYQLSNCLMEDSSGVQRTFPVPLTTPNESNGHIQHTGSDLRQTTQSFRGNHCHYNLNCGDDSQCENESRNTRPQADSRGKHQVLPRYWPRFTNQDLQNLSTDSKSVITPLFEKMLSASDAGRIGRLVLPKKCAEAYLPQILHPEGLPLKVQDSTGKEWIFQFRFWPNNNSRMYVLEGVTPCIQHMQLQAGDTVTFSRLDPEGKLIMGFRKASVAQASDQENDSTKNSCGICTNGDAEPAHPHLWSKADKSAYIAKEALGVKSSRKRKNSTMGLKSKRLKIENTNLMKLKLTWEEAQGLLQPPPNIAPTIIVVEGFEFEEYEDAPIIGKAAAFATDTSFRSPFSADEEVGTGQLDNMFLPPNSGSKTLKAVKQEAHAVEGMEEVDTLGVSGEGLPVSPKTTTKHPRHRLGCTCIVCIQPPSGKGPKHEQNCTCTVCQMVKRRFRTLMLRREKKQSEKEESTKKDQQLLSSDEEQHQSDNNFSVNHKSDDDHLLNKPSTSPLKGQIDLNIRPERDEGSPSGSDSTAMRRLLPHDGTEEMCIMEPGLSIACSRSISVINQANQGDGGKLTTNSGVGERTRHALLTTETYAPP